MSPRSPDRRCARCRKPQAADFAPFCSAGCKDRDLLDWIGERHRLPGDAPDSDAGDRSDDADDALDKPGYDG